MLLYYLRGILFILIRIIFFIISFIFIFLKLSLFLEWNVLLVNRLIINIFIYLDWISLMFIFAVLIISSIIIFYRREYISHDRRVSRFFYLVFLFILSILLIILSPNLIRILIGWDGLGLISYCLVIYYQRYSSYNSGILTILINRVGDVLILISIRIIILYGSWNFINSNKMIRWVLVIVVIAAFTKRAQFPFSSWLPAAIAAPTPVSSLVHSSTLVTAGVYLLIRFHYLIFKDRLLRIYIMISGLITILFAGFSANFEYDFKKIIAYSTLSQLGLIIIILGFNYIELAYFHLVIHAMFKSIMFICSGVVIHRISNYQDIRYIGILYNFMPLTSVIFIVANFSLCGIPFISGFYSKDQILEFIIFNMNNFICYILMILGTGLTVSYRIRLSYYLINKIFMFFPINNVIDFKIINIPIFILLLLSIRFGYLINWILFSMIDELFIIFIEKILILLICVLFIYIGFNFYQIKIRFKLIYFLKYFGGKMWFLYNLNFIIIKIPLIFGLIIKKNIDKGWSEWIFKNSIESIIKIKFINLNNNYLVNLLIIISYMIVILLWFYLNSLIKI